MEKKKREDGRNRSLNLCVRRASVWWILAVLLVCPSVTHANHFEFEIDAAEFGDLVRENAVYEGFTSDAFCPQMFSSFYGINFLDDIDFPSSPGPFVRPSPSSTDSEYYSDIDVTNNYPTQLVVPVILKFKHADDFYDPATGIDEFDGFVDVNLVFALTVNNAEICFSYSGVEPNVSYIEDYIYEIEGFFSVMGCLPVDLSTSFDMLLGGLLPAHAGITSDDQGDRLVFRVEFSEDGVVDPSPSNSDSWDDFYNSWTSAATLTYDWNILFHQQLLRDNLESRISDAIDAASKINLFPSMISSWTPDGANGGQVILDFDVRYYPTDWTQFCSPIDAEVGILIEIYEDSDNLIIDGMALPRFSGQFSYAATAA